MSRHEYVNETTPTTGDRATLKGALRGSSGPRVLKFYPLWVHRGSVTQSDGILSKGRFNSLVKDRDDRYLIQKNICSERPTPLL